MGATPWRFKSSRPQMKIRSVEDLNGRAFLLGAERRSPVARGQVLSSAMVLSAQPYQLEFGQLAQLVRASRLHREGLRFES